MKQRDLSLDLIRIMACVMVVVMHSPIPSDNANGLLLSTLSYFTTPCIGLFFMVSGALILPPPRLHLKAMLRCRSCGSGLSESCCPP